MNTFAIEKWFDEGRLCSFYTVRWEDCKDLSFKFTEAQQFAKRISEALQDGTIVPDYNNRTLVDFQGNYEIFI